MPLLQVQLRHRFRQHRLRPRQRRRIRRTIVIGQGDGGGNAQRGSGPGGGGGGGGRCWWCWRCWGPSRTDLVVRHDERQIDLRERVVEVGRALARIALRRIKLEHAASLVLGAGQALDLHLLDLLRIQLNVFLNLAVSGVDGV